MHFQLVNLQASRRLSQPQCLRRFQVYVQAIYLLVDLQRRPQVCPQGSHLLSLAVCPLGRQRQHQLLYLLLFLRLFHPQCPVSHLQVTRLVSHHACQLQCLLEIHLTFLLAFHPSPRRQCLPYLPPHSLQQTLRHSHPCPRLANRPSDHPDSPPTYRQCSLQDFRLLFHQSSRLVNRR